MKTKNEQRFILSPHKGRKREKKRRFVLHSDFILIRNWFLSLVNFPHLHEFITKLPI